MNNDKTKNNAQLPGAIREPPGAVRAPAQYKDRDDHRETLEDLKKRYPKSSVQGTQVQGWGSSNQKK